MRHVGLAVLVVGTALGMAAPARAEQETLPTGEEIHELFDDGKYPEVLKKLSRVLALKGNAAKAYDRYDLLMLKGEAHLQTRAGSAAMAAFKQAAEEAPDPQAASVARATERLVRRSKNLAYEPAVRDPDNPSRGAGEPIDIRDARRRRDALAALFADEMAAAAPRFKAARSSRTLPPIAEAISAAAGLHD